MATKSKKVPASKSKPAAPDLAEQVGSVAEALQPLYQLDALSDNLNDIANGLRWLAETRTLSAIAEFGSGEDRERAVEALKSLAETRFDS